MCQGRCVDELESQLSKHGSLKKLYFYHQHLTTVSYSLLGCSVHTCSMRVSLTHCLVCTCILIIGEEIWFDLQIILNMLDWKSRVGFSQHYVCTWRAPTTLLRMAWCCQQFSRMCFSNCSWRGINNYPIIAHSLLFYIYFHLNSRF